MRRLIRGVALAALLPALCWAQGIRNSPHDLSMTSSATVKATAETQICKFCHTPHTSQSTQLLWNHTQTAQAGYSWGNDLDGSPITMTGHGTNLPTTLRNASKRCLGCHDGSVAIGDVSNVGTGGPGRIAVAVVAGRTDANGNLINAGVQVGVGGSMAGSHPVSIPYAAQTGYNGQNSGVPPSLVDNAIGNYWMVRTTGCTSPSGVCTQASGAPVDGAAINLIPQTPGSATNVGIECGTCHEPHNKTGLPYFSRVDMNQSGLCRSCHNK